MNLPLDGKNAIVTGGSRGIGNAIVRRLARDGAKVLFSYASSTYAAEELVGKIEADGGMAGAVRADSGRVSDIEKMFTHAREFFGKPDILVNNAGITEMARLDVVTEESYDRVMDTNAKGTFFAMREAAKHLNDGGRIINLSSIVTVKPVEGNAVYAASKGAIEQMTRVAARELGSRGITVNAVSPGITETEGVKASLPQAMAEALRQQTPLGRLGTPEDIIGLVVFLAGPDGRWITGENIRVTGGLG
jgi:3-oxoacyl-[acyl-carrier protein] reductase